MRTTGSIIVALVDHGRAGTPKMASVGRCETLSKSGRGKKGGLSQYAERLGRTSQYIRQLWNAAKVLDTAKPKSQLSGFTKDETPT